MTEKRIYAFDFNYNEKDKIMTEDEKIEAIEKLALKEKITFGQAARKYSKISKITTEGDQETEEIKKRAQELQESEKISYGSAMKLAMKENNEKKKGVAF